MSVFCNYFVDGKYCESDDAECLEDTFRPSLFRRIDSASSLQSFEMREQVVLEQSIPNINISALSKNDDKELWDVSMLNLLENEKGLKKIPAERQSRRGIEDDKTMRKEQMREEKPKISVTPEQYLIECDYFNTKIEYFQQKNKELEAKNESLEEKIVGINKEALVKDKKILWLESEIFAKESRLKALNEMEKELERLKHCKESGTMYKEKALQLESQIDGYKKENRELINEVNRIKSLSQQEIQKLLEDKEKFTKSLELQKNMINKSEDELKKYKESIEKLDSENNSLRSKILMLQSEISEKSKSSPSKGNKILKAIANLLRIDDENEILPKIEDLLKIKNHSKFVARLAGLVKDCSPSGTFSDAPSTTQMWKYIRRIMESYIDLCKKQQKFIKIFNLIEEADDFTKVKSLLSSSGVN